MENNMYKILKTHNLVDEFKHYLPSEKNGYAYDKSKMICLLKSYVNNDNHSDATFSVCCMILKNKLNKEDINDKEINE